MADKRSKLTLRLEPELLQKFHFVIDYNARSANGELTLFVRRVVRKFEKEHGEIILK